MKISIGSKVKSDPAISIIIPNYNTADYISETLESVFYQTFTDFEVIVLNDGSPDSAKLYPVLEPFRDRIILIDKPTNDGTSATRNLGVDHARAKVISFLDADDIWSPTFLEELVEFLLRTGFDMVYADAEQFRSGKDKKIGDFLRFNPQQGEVTREMCVAGKCIILPSGTLIKRSTFLAVGGFDPNVTRTEDSDLWMRLLFNGARIGYLRKILFRFRISPGSGSGNLVERIERDVIRWRTLQKKLDFTDDENRLIEKHIARDEASVLRAKGRIYLEAGEWQLARQMFLEAKQRAAELGLPLIHRLKLRLVLFMLLVWPPALRQMFRRIRRDEIEFMPKEKLEA